ncbi:hypothetical protein HaLaN_16031, partial [Haematococcus lacustris]
MQAHYLPQRATPVAPAAEQQDSQVSEAQQQQAGQGALAGARHGADIVVAAGTPRLDLTSCSRDELVTQVQTMQAIVSKLTDELRHAKQERTKGMSLFIKLKSVLAARESMQFSAASVTASHPTPVVESGEADAPEGWGAGQPRGSIGDDGHHPGYRAAPGATGHPAAFTTLGSAVPSALNAGAALHPSCIQCRQGSGLAASLRNTCGAVQEYHSSLPLSQVSSSPPSSKPALTQANPSPCKDFEHICTAPTPRRTKQPCKRAGDLEAVHDQSSPAATQVAASNRACEASQVMETAGDTSSTSGFSHLPTEGSPLNSLASLGTSHLLPLPAPLGDDEACSTFFPHDPCKRGGLGQSIGQDGVGLKHREGGARVTPSGAGQEGLSE